MENENYSEEQYIELMKELEEEHPLIYDKLKGKDFSLVKTQSGFITFPKINSLTQFDFQVISDKALRILGQNNK